MKLGEIRKIDSGVLQGDDLVFEARVMCDCGREWWEGDSFCPRCGRKLPENHPGVITATVKPDEMARIGEARIREKFAQLCLGGGSAEGGATTEGKRKVKAWAAMYRTGRDGSWYMSEFIYRDARRFDELRRLCAERCDREGDSYGAAAWRDDSGVKLIPVEVEIPDGVELMNIDCASGGEGGAE